MEFSVESHLRSFPDRLPIVCQSFFRAELAAACPTGAPIKRPVKRTAHRRGAGLQNGEFQFHGCEVTLLKNQMKSAMMAKPADKNIQSGNSRVKVTLYGWVNRAVRFASTQHQSELQSIDNTHSGSRLGVRAVGSLNPNLTGAATLELDIRGNGRHQGDFDSPAGSTIGLRHSNLALTHKDMGTLGLGHGWLAGASSHGGSFSGTGIVFGIWGPGGDAVKATKGPSIKGKDRHLVSYQLWGPRSNRIYYSTPSIGGASLEASYNDDRSWSSGFFYSGLPGVKAIGFKLNAGYRSNPRQGTDGSTTVAVSAGIKHNASGLSLNGVYNQEQFKGKGGLKPVAWMAEASWTGKIMDAGSTSASFGYGQWGDGMDGKSTRFHFAVNQNVDSAAADVYFGVSYDTGNVTHTVAHGEDRRNLSNQYYHR